MRALVALSCAVCALAAGCGGGSDPGAETLQATGTMPAEGRSLTAAGADRERYVGRSGTARATACELVALGRVERIASRELGEPVDLVRRANDSLDLSFCRFRAPEDLDLALSIGLDTATRAVRRYYNMLTEARQLPNIFDPSRQQRPQLVFGVGDDGTYGGAGAYWVPLRAQLTSIRGDHIVKVHFYEPRVPSRKAKRAAAGLAKLAFAGYGRRRGG